MTSRGGSAGETDAALDATTRSVPAAVAAAVRRDAVLQEALARGVVNLRALARWIIKSHGLSASEAAVLSALRRTELDRESAFASARALLAGATLRTRTGVCVLVAERSPRVRDALAHLLRGHDAESGALRVIQGDFVRLVGDRSAVRRLREILPAEARLEVEEGLTEIAVVLPHRAREASGVLATVCGALASRRIEAREAMGDGEEHVVLVREADAVAAYAALSELVQRPRGAAGDADG